MMSTWADRVERRFLYLGLHHVLDDDRDEPVLQESSDCLTREGVRADFQRRLIPACALPIASTRTRPDHDDTTIINRGRRRIVAGAFHISLQVFKTAARDRRHLPTVVAGLIADDCRGGRATMVFSMSGGR